MFDNESFEIYKISDSNNLFHCKFTRYSSQYPI